MSKQISSFTQRAAYVALMLALAPLAQASDGRYTLRVYSPGVVTSSTPEVPPDVPDVPSVPPPPVHDYARLISGGTSFTIDAEGLAATHNGYSGASAGNVRANIGLSAGKWYWEVRRGAVTTNVAVGLSSGAYNTLTGTAWGANPANPAFRVAYSTGFGLSSGTTPNVKSVPMPTSESDLLSFALDMDTGMLRVFHNCVEHAIWSGMSGTWYPAASTGGGPAGGVITANFGATPFSCPVPDGYNAGVWAP